MEPKNLPGCLAIFSERMQRAYLVAAYLNDELAGQDGYWLESYANCREQGFTLKAPNFRSIVFSEYRNTDEIVVYVGLDKDFSPGGNIPSEEVYEAKKFFESEIEAAAYILQQVKG